MAIPVLPKGYITFKINHKPQKPKKVQFRKKTKQLSPLV